MFLGPNAYITPSWYATKHQTGKVVPTWNYAVVHIHGVAALVDDAAGKRAIVEELTGRFERFENVPRALIHRGEHPQPTEDRLFTRELPVIIDEALPGLAFLGNDRRPTTSVEPVERKGHRCRGCRLPAPPDARLERLQAYFTDRRAANWINGETRLSWSAQLPPANRLREGRWFDARSTAPAISVDQMWVDMFKLHLGDELTLRVGELLLPNIPAGRLDARFSFQADTLDVEQLDFAAAGALGLNGKGRIEHVSQAPAGGVDFALSAANPDSLRIAADLFGLPESVGRSKHLSALAPLDIKVSLVAAREGDATSASISIGGKAGGSVLSLTGRALGDPAKPGDASG
jgi:hypothetical protein